MRLGAWSPLRQLQLVVCALLGEWSPAPLRGSATQPRFGVRGDGDSYRIKNALAALFFARGTPIVSGQKNANHKSNTNWKPTTCSRKPQPTGRKSTEGSQPHLRSPTKKGTVLARSSCFPQCPGLGVLRHGAGPHRAPGQRAGAPRFGSVWADSFWPRWDVCFGHVTLVVQPAIR